MSPDTPATSRFALQITPDTGRLDARTLENAFERHHSLDFDLELEFPLVARDDVIEYYVTAEST